MAFTTYRIIFAEQWNKDIMSQLLQQVLKTGNGTCDYDMMLIMLPNVDSHGHHTSSELMALEAIERLHEQNLANSKIPTVIGGAEFRSVQVPSYPLNKLSEVVSSIPYEFSCNRKWKLSNTTNIPDNETIVLGACSEHKSQGTSISETITTYKRTRI